MMAAISCCLTTACMNDNDSFDIPDTVESSYGNNELKETNVVTIQSLMTKYKATIDANNKKLIEEPMQIKGHVTGNDVGGNYYKKLTIQDETAAMTIDIDESGLWGYLPLGEEILVELKDLYIGGYGKMAQIGVPYRSKKGVEGIGRMPKSIWQQHFKVLHNQKEVEPIEFTKTVMNDMEANSGRLVIFKDVTFEGADGVKRLKDGPEAALQGYFITYFNEFPDMTGYYRKVQVFTSGSYAKFSTFVLPYDKEAGKPIPCDIIGVATRYNDQWQISIRQASDIIVKN